MSAKQKYVGSSLTLDQFFCSYFGSGRLFRNFFKWLQRVPSFFFYFVKDWMFKNSQRPPYYIFRHYATYRRFQKKIETKIHNFSQFFPHVGTVEKNTWHFEVLLLFLSLRYGADLGRSQLVTSVMLITASLLRSTGIHVSNLLWDTESYRKKCSKKKCPKQRPIVDIGRRRHWLENHVSQNFCIGCMTRPSVLRVALRPSKSAFFKTSLWNSNGTLLLFAAAFRTLKLCHGWLG